MSRRLRGILTAALAIIATVTVAVLATLADGRTATQASTHDGGAWLINREVGAVAHVNRLAGEITGAVRIAEPMTPFDIDQAPEVIVVHDRAAASAVLLDDRTFSPSVSLVTDDHDAVHAVASGVVAVTYDPVSAQRLDLDVLSSVGSFAEVGTSLAGEGPGLVTIDLDDRVVLVDAAGTLRAERAHDEQGEQDAWSLAPLQGRPAQLTVVGTSIVVLTEAGELFVVDDDVRRLTAPGGVQAGDWVLQQPGPAATTVVAISPDGEVAAIDLASGEPRGIGALSGGLPLAPIVHGGCVFSVVLQPPVFTRQCGDAVDETPLGDEARTPTELRLRLVNGWVWVNDVDVGTAWVVDVDDEVTRIDDWDAVLGQQHDSDELELAAEDGFADEQRENPDDAEIVVNPDLPDLTGPNLPPIARPDVAATRQDRPVVVDVLANDEDPNGDVLLVTEVLNRSEDVAVVEPTGDGSAVQVVPAAGFTGTIRFSYTISDGRGGTASADVSVDVTPMDPDRNRPPEPVTDVATVRAGESVTLNVLVNDRDPDGDLLSLRSVRGEGVSVVHTPDGTVTITPDPDQVGRIDLVYVVADEFGATAEGRILLEVRLPDSNRAPIAHNDTAQTLVDRRIVLDVLANDHDPDGDRLLVQAQPELLVAPEGADPFVHLDARGLLDFEAALPGTYVLAYIISDGSLTDVALVRIEVGDRDDNRPPVAVRDEVVVPRGESRIVPVLRNDHDPDGDVVSLVHWEGTDGLVVEELERDRFRVTAEPDAPDVATFRYEISDGVNEPVGTVVSVLVVDPEPPLPPVAVDDEVEVRAGQVSLLYVLDNDYDPAGEDLRIVGVSEPAEAQPMISAEARAIALDVPVTTTQGFTFGYEIANPRGDRAAATVRVRVVPDDDPNRAPIAGTDIARTTQGQDVTIDVLANDRDPDGDPIDLEGIARQPANGTAEVLPDGRVRYEPDPTFAGTDRFAYHIVDAYGAQALGEVLVGVTPIWPENRPPEAQDDVAVARVGGESVTIDVLANDRDPDGDPLRVVSVTSPSLGAAGVPDDGLAVVFQPPERADPDREEVSLSYTIDDGRGGQDSAIITVTLLHDEVLPDPPVAVDDRVGPVTPGEVVVAEVLDNDRIPAETRATIRVEPSAPEVTVTPAGALRLEAPERTGTYRYTITDEHDQSSSAVLTVVVQDNRPPVVTPLTVETDFETPVDINVTNQASDPDDDELFFVCCDTVRGGSAQVTSGDARRLEVSFRPDSGFSGRAGFSYIVDDQQGHQVAGSVTVIVAPEQLRPPVAADGSMQVEAGRSASLDLRPLVSDVEPGTDLRFSLGERSGPVQASVDGASLRVQASVDAVGSTGRVTYTVTDANGQSDQGRVDIEVTPSTAPLPIVRPDAARTIQGEPVVVRVLDNDVGEDLVVVTARGTTNANAEVVDGGQAVRLIPGATFFGTTTATYVVRDRYNDPNREATGQIELTVIGRPGVPGVPSVTSDSRQATLVWTTPPSNGAPIEAFEVEHDQGGVVTLDATSTYTWTGLTNGTTYRFRVRAVNEAGPGEFSPWSSPVTPDQVPGRPGAPQVRFGDGELVVSWEPPVNEGTPISTYVLEIGGATTGVRELPASGAGTQTYVWSGLANGASHTFRVKAVNAADEAGGDFSSWSEPEHPLTQPSAPGVPTLEGGPNYLEVTWPRPSDGGDPIQAYEIQIDSASGATVRVSGATTTSYRWANLTNGVDHRFRVRAWNRDERGGQWSEFSAPGRACDVPGQPTAPGVTRGDRAIEVTWSAPATNGCELLGYELSVDGGTTTRSVAPGALSTTLDGLTNGQSYQVQLRARNEQGDGPWSPRSSSVVPAGPPTRPSISTIEATAAGELRVRWSEADPNGAAISRYELSVNNGPAQNLGLTTQHTLTGLTPGTSYSVRVRAVNDVDAGEWSASQSRSAEGVPSRVSGLSATSPSRGTLRWTWDAPGNNGSSITRYDVDRSSNNSGLIQTTSRNHTWDGLGDNTTRDIRVRACNRHGCGTWSNSVSGTTQPPPPTTFSVRVGAHSSCPEPNFSPPTNWNGGDCNGYSQHSWIPANTNLTVTCRNPNGWLAEGTRNWLRITGGTWDRLFVNENTLSSVPGGIPNC